MKYYEQFLSNKGIKVVYIESQDELSNVSNLLASLKKEGLKKVHFADPCDDYLEGRIDRGAANNLERTVYNSPMFLNSKNELDDYFRPDKKRFLMANFYKKERIKRGVLLAGKDSPQGGQWSFDKQNRKKYPKDKTPPVIQFPDANDSYHEARVYVENHFKDCYGTVGESPLYPTDFEASKQWWKQFLEQRFTGFGPYEDAIVMGQPILHHSVITPMLNTGLLTPAFVLSSSIDYAQENNIAINTIEGFVRQIMGWREFMRGMYLVKGREMRTTNYWNFTRKIPASFYTGQTGVAPVDHIIKNVLQTGYCHHIERLMVLGNFMLLCEFDPKEVYRWFMELFVDSYDWVMVPNVYGMSQFADGGILPPNLI
jgi:deoxyribodipyrimidine photolyase-related protein